MAENAGALAASAVPLPDKPRWRTRASQAYTQPGSVAAAQLSDVISLLVFVSLLAMVLEGVPGLQEQYGSWFFLAETVVAGLFTVDYVANIMTQRPRRSYVLGPWGIIDLLAILPFFVTLAHVTGESSAARSLLALRALRVLRVLKLAKVAEEAAEEEASGIPVHHPSFWRDLLFGLILSTAALAIAEAAGLEHGHQLYWLSLGSGLAFSIAARRWALRHGLSPISILLVMATLIGGAAAAVSVDREGDAGRATTTALLTLAVIAISWLTMEAQEGAL